MYKDYTISLAYDLAQTKQKRAFSDHSDIVSRRMGFIPLPLGVIMLRVLYTSVKSTNPGAVLVFMMAFICLFTFRVLCSVVILGKACDLIEVHKIKQRTGSYEDVRSADNNRSSSSGTPHSYSSSRKYDEPAYTRSSPAHSKVMEIKSVPLTAKELPKNKSELNTNIRIDEYQRKSTETVEASGSSSEKMKCLLVDHQKSSSEKIISTMSMNMTLNSIPSLTKSLSSPDLIRSEADFDEVRIILYNFFKYYF